MPTKIPRHVFEAFQKQLDETVPVRLRCAEDLLKLPPEIERRVQEELEIEEIEEALRTQGEP